MFLTRFFVFVVVVLLSFLLLLLLLFYLYLFIFIFYGKEHTKWNLSITGTFDKKVIKYYFFVKVKKKEVDVGDHNGFTFEFELFEPKSLVKSRLTEIARGWCWRTFWQPLHYSKKTLMMTSTQNVTGNISLTHPDNHIQSALLIYSFGLPGLLSRPFNFLIAFFPFLVVFFDSSSSCLLVWRGICCQTVLRTRCERQRRRQGEIVNVFLFFFLHWINTLLERVRAREIVVC